MITLSRSGAAKLSFDTKRCHLCFTLSSHSLVPLASYILTGRGIRKVTFSLLVSQATSWEWDTISTKKTSPYTKQGKRLFSFQNKHLNGERVFIFSIAVTVAIYISVKRITTIIQWHDICLRPTKDHTNDNHSSFFTWGLSESGNVFNEGIKGW